MEDSKIVNKYKYHIYKKVRKIKYALHKSRITSKLPTYCTLLSET